MRRELSGIALLLGVTALTPVSVSAESINEALALAYSNNPGINVQRASTRVVDENVAIAKSGYRPVITGDADIGKSWSQTNSPFGKSNLTLHPGGFGVTISQSLFDGFQTRNNVSAADAQVLASRAALRNVEQNVLFDAASAYMDVLRDMAIADYREQSLKFLIEQVRSENSRFEVGESTRTDVALAKGRKAAADAQLAAARAQLKSSRAIYRQVVGKDPTNLKRPGGVSRLIPGSLNQAIEIGYANHPAIEATKHLVDQALFNVKSTEGSLLPGVVLQGTANRRYDIAENTDRDSASITARLNIPIYQGGRVSAQVRQSKELLGQRRLEVDQSVDNVRAAVVSSYSQMEAADAASTANRAQLEAARLALQGAVEERNVGQRTTLDVLNTQQDVLNAQIALAQADRDTIVATYAVLSATGGLTTTKLGLKIPRYEPEDHYIQVKDKWFGLRTPDGQ